MIMAIISIIMLVMILPQGLWPFLTSGLKVFPLQVVREDRWGWMLPPGGSKFDHGGHGDCALMFMMVFFEVWWSYLRKMIMMMFTSELQYMPSLTRVSPNLFSRLWRRFNIILIIVVVLGIWMIVTSLIIIMILKTTSEGNGRPTCIGNPLVLLSTCT